MIPNFSPLAFILCWLSFCTSITYSQNRPVEPSDLIVTTVSSRGIQLSWTDNSNNEEGFQIERSLNPNTGFEPLATLEADATGFINFDLPTATNYYYRVRSFNAGGVSPYTTVVSGKTNDNPVELPNYWTSIDVGTTRDGTAKYQEHKHIVTGDGWMFDNSDTFHFVYVPLNGNGQIVAKLENVLKAHWNHTGVMIRESLENDSQYAMTELYRNERSTLFIGRRDGDEDLIKVLQSNDVDEQLWLKLERVGNEFISWMSKDGVNWTETHRETITMGVDTVIGLASYCPRSDKNTISTWTNVYAEYAPTVLAPPTNLELHYDLVEAVELTWEDHSDNETGFVIERALKAENPNYEVIAQLEPNNTYYKDESLTPGEIYFYRVRGLRDKAMSIPTKVEKIEIFKIPNSTFYLQHLAGEYDRTNKNNTIDVTKTPDTIKNVLRHPGMMGKQLNVNLEDPLSSANGSLTFSISPDIREESADFFKSPPLTMRFTPNNLSFTVNGTTNTYDVALDTIFCNHIAMRFKDGVMSPYINGQWYDDVEVGEFEVQDFTLDEFQGTLWNLRFVKGQISDAAITDLSNDCISNETPVPDTDFPYRLCTAYDCGYTETKELRANNGKKRGRVYASSIMYDRTIFGAGMHFKATIDERVSKQGKMNLDGNWEYFSIDNLFPPERGNTQYWLHEIFHSYQVPMLKAGKWLAEATADWSSWNFYRKPLKSTAWFTLTPHLSLMAQIPVDGRRFVKQYHSAILFAYITEFGADDLFIGRLYTKRASVEWDPFGVVVTTLEEDYGGNFRELYADFATRTSVWDYPNPQISDDFEVSERNAIIGGMEDHKFASVLDEAGTYGIYQKPLKEYIPGSYAWNAHKIDSTAAATYTVKFKGSVNNPQGSEFRCKIVRGVKGAYEYIDLPVTEAITLGNGEVEYSFDSEGNEQLFFVAVTTPTAFGGYSSQQFEYEFAIESSEHILDDNHIKHFILEQETRPAIIDHENFTIDAEVVRGTDPSALIPEVRLYEGATSTPANGDTVDFTNPVTYQVTGLISGTKDWVVTVNVVPPRTGTDILTFDLDNEVAPFVSIDNANHVVMINQTTDANLSTLAPIFTLSEGATSSPVSGETLDLSVPIVITVTAEDGITTQDWTVFPTNFRPFITTWETLTANEQISVGVNDSYDYNFEYVWKSEDNSIIKRDFVQTGDPTSFSATLPTPGKYTLEIKGTYGHFTNYPKAKLKDVNQWGNIIWRDMSFTFTNWDGEGFSATDVPNTSNVTSMFKTFLDAENFNGDISQWDVGNVSDMTDAFRGTKKFNGDISQWDVGNVSNMTEMFREARAFNSDISQWDVRRLKKAYRMFFAASSFDRNLGNWHLESATDLREMLTGSISDQNYDRLLIGWAEKNIKGHVPLGGGNLKFCAGEKAKAYLVEQKKWVIDDGGLGCPPGGGTDILFFELAEQTAPAIINDTDFTIAIEVEGGTDITNLTPILTLSEGATSTPANGEITNFTNTVTYTVTALDGITTQDWVVTVTVAPFTETDILSFVINEQLSDAVIDAETHTINLEVVPGTNVTSLVPVITLSEGATSIPSSVQPQDFSTPVIYTVTAKDGITTQEWIVRVGQNVNTETDFLSFTLEEQTNDAIIDYQLHTITLEVGAGTDITALVPEFALSVGATSTPNIGDSINFSDSVIYTVTAEDGITTQDWMVTIILQGIAETGTDILSFELAEQISEAIIDPTNNMITVEVNSTTDITALAPKLTLSTGAISSPASGELLDFTNTVIYTVTAEDGITTQDWMVNIIPVLIPEDMQADILSFTIPEQTRTAIIDPTYHTIIIEVGYGTDMSALTPTFTLSSGATSTPSSGETTDFTDPVTYTVTAADGITIQEWMITVTQADPPEMQTDIINFILPEQFGKSVINPITHKVSAEVVYNTDVTALTPTVTVSEGAISVPGNNDTIDFTNPVIYTVTSQDGSLQQDWEVSVVEAKDIYDDLLSHVGWSVFYYPNPVKEGYFTINFGSDLFENIDMELFDTFGKQISFKSTRLNKREIMIDFTGSSGMYFMHFSMSDGQKTFNTVLKILK